MHSELDEALHHHRLSSSLAPKLSCCEVDLVSVAKSRAAKLEVWSSLPAVTDLDKATQASTLSYCRRTAA